MFVSLVGFVVVFFLLNCLTLFVLYTVYSFYLENVLLHSRFFGIYTHISPFFLLDTEMHHFHLCSS